MNDGTVAPPQPTKADVLACSFHSWHPVFAKHSLRAHSFKLSPDFLAYLTDDGSVVLPGATGAKRPQRHDSGSEDEDFEVRLNRDEVGDDAASGQGLQFPELDSQIEKCLTEFEGAVFPKLNWSAPCDAAWINFNKTLKCMCPADVYLLLKSSERVDHDLRAAFCHCSDLEGDDERPEVEFHLVLKKWYDMRPQREFRCFVRERRLVGVSQRNIDGGKHRAFFDENREMIVDSLMSFFDRHVRDRFPRSNCVFDAYWTVNGHWRIIDFNPFGAPTDPLLFSWSDLTDAKLTRNGVMRPEFRYEDGEDSGIVPHPMEMYGMPLDMIDLATGNDPQKFMDLLRESVRRQQQNESSSDDE